MKCSSIVVWGLSSALLFASSVLAQSLEEVEAAVRTYFDSEEDRLAANEHLSQWGDGAVEHLRTLANSQDSSIAWAVVVCAQQIGTAQAMGLVVDVLDKQTAISPSCAVGLLIPTFDVGSGVEHTRVLLVSHPRFKPALQQIATHGTWLDKSVCATVAAAQDWKDFEPLIRDMLKDDNVALRRKAANALEQLTSRDVKVKQPETVFEKTDLIPDLLLEAVPLPVGEFGSVSQAVFLRRGSDAPQLMLGDGRRFASYPWTNHSEVLRFAIPAIDIDVLEVASGQRQFIALTSESGFAGAGADYAVSWDDQGREVWRYCPPNRGLKTAAILYGDREPYGVAFGPGGKIGVIAVDANGKTLWEIPRVHVLYELETHPKLPGTLLVIGGPFFLTRHGPSGIENGEGARRFNMIQLRRLYASTGVLFPGRDGAPEMLIAGSRPSDSQSELICFDAASEVKWSAPFRHRINQLAMLELDDDLRLFVVTTDGDEMFVVDQSGVLRWSGRTPGTKEGDESPIFELAVGTYGSDGAAIAMDHKRGFFVSPLRLEALRGAPR